MATLIVMTPGQRLWADVFGAESWKLNPDKHEQYEQRAANLQIPPATKEVPDPPTDGMLLSKALGSFSTSVSYETAAAEFLRMRAERDGTNEPLLVTPSSVSTWLEAYSNSDTDKSLAEVLAVWINQHRGVRLVPVPQVTVTAEMFQTAFTKGFSWQSNADYLNAALAKSATMTTTAPPMKVAAIAVSKNILHTFEDDEDRLRFCRAQSWDAYVSRAVAGHEHHPRKEDKV